MENTYKTVRCPCCGAVMPFTVDEKAKVSFDMREANIKILCSVCKRKIKLSVK